MTGQELVRRASAHLGQAYQLGAAADLEDPDYAGPWDCADFVSWCVYHTHGLKLGLTVAGHPYSGAWIRWAEDPANAIDLEAAYDTPGAILVRVRIITGRAMWRSLTGRAARSRREASAMALSGPGAGDGSGTLRACPSGPKPLRFCRVRIQAVPFRVAPG